jgi:hypothetical protein
LKQLIEGVFLYKVFAGKGRRPSSGKRRLLFSGTLYGKIMAKFG